MFLGLRTVIYHAPDVSKAKAWYAAAFGVAYWGVADIEAAYRHLLDRGAIPRQPVKDVGGDIRVATVADPFGNVIGLIQNPHFKVKG